MSGAERKGTDNGKASEEDLFEVALDNATKADKDSRKSQDRRSGPIGDKRRRKDAKFGFGGKKRFSKSSDSVSTGDLRGFSTKKMKGQKSSRLGKSRRTKQL